MLRFSGPDGRAAILALFLLAGCQPAQGGVDCAAPPWWQGAKPGQPNAEMAACLRDKAYDARGLAVSQDSKVAGIVAQCEVDVDLFEGGMPFGGATGSDEERAARERRVNELATAAVLAYQSCTSP